ncbi:popeye domain-containing protein 1-A-like [Glandiceps talaboti]
MDNSTTHTPYSMKATGSFQVNFSRSGNHTLTTTNTDGLIQDFGETVCQESYDHPHHVLFQLGHLCLAIAICTPKTFAQHALFLRCVLIPAYLFLFVWAATISCLPDFFGWTVTFFVVNICQIVRIFYDVWPTQINSELEEIYEEVFEPLKVTRKQFKRMTKFANIYCLEEGEYYANEDATIGDERLSILLSGRMVTTCEGVCLHHVQSNEFLDSPEWISIGQGSGDAFLVSIRAITDCRHLTWSRSKLKTYLSKEPFLAAVLDTVVGKDVACKMQIVKEQILLQGWQHDVAESKEKLHSGGYHSITSELSIIEEAMTLLPGNRSGGQFDTCVDTGNDTPCSVSFETNL